MKKGIILLFVCCIIFAQSIKAQAVKSETNSLLWEISGKGLPQPSYLFGTFHILCPEQLEVTEALKNKLKATEQLVLELDFDDPNLSTEMQKHMILSNGKTLKDYLNEQEYKLVNQFFQDSMGMPLEQLISIKPFVISSFLYPKFLGCQTASWEQTLVQLAQKQNSQVIGLETVAGQISTIDKMTYEVQADMLLESIKDYNNTRNGLQEMVALYQQQQVEGIYDYSEKEFSQYPGMSKYMLEDRNRNWIPQIEKLAKAKPTFFAVGAGHLGGKSGVIALLKAKGYTVKPIPNVAAPKTTPANDNSTAALLTRKWKMDESVIPQAVEDVLENVRLQNPEQAKMLEAQKDALAAGLRASVVEYKANGNYDMQIMGRIMSGTWTLSADNKQLLRKDENGEETVNQLVEISKDKLIIINSKQKKIIYNPL
ncbi:MAG: TraB/GumN family protein [Saprospiraceae bacterium]